jgi:hypothetical protein
LRKAPAESTAHKKRAFEEEEKRTRAESETAIAFKRDGEAGGAMEIENATTARALR